MSKSKVVLLFTTDGTYMCDGLPRPVKIGGGFQGDLGCGACARFTRCTLSHVATLATFVKNLDAVNALCKTQGWQFMKGQKTWKWFGRWANDYGASNAAYKNGVSVEDYGKCDHAIRVPGTSWEIGLVAVGQVRNEVTGVMEDGGFRLVYDFYGSSGAPLQAAIGKEGGLFLQGYGVELAKITAAAQGYTDVTQTTLANGDIQIEVGITETTDYNLYLQ